MRKLAVLSALGHDNADVAVENAEHVVVAPNDHNAPRPIFEVKPLVEPALGKQSIAKLRLEVSVHRLNAHRAAALCGKCSEAFERRPERAPLKFDRLRPCVSTNGLKVPRKCAAVALELFVEPKGGTFAQPGSAVKGLVVARHAVATVGRRRKKTLHGLKEVALALPFVKERGLFGHIGRCARTRRWDFLKLVIDGFGESPDHRIFGEAPARFERHDGCTERPPFVGNIGKNRARPHGCELVLVTQNNEARLK